MKKRKGYAIIGLLILIIGIVTINAIVDQEKAWHDSSDILITVNGYDITLQEAIDNEYLKGISSPSSSTIFEVPNPGHSADKIWVSVNGDETTLQDAVLIVNGVCGYDSPSSSYTESINVGQLASEIEISPGTSLQDGINSGQFCCVANMGDSCGGSICVNPGTIICDGTCVGTSPKNNRGTNCEGDYKSCDGNGNCLGWNGYGCGNCPNGVYVYSPYRGIMYFCKWQGSLGALQGRMQVDWTNPPYWQAWSYAQISAQCSYDNGRGIITNYNWQQKPY